MSCSGEQTALNTVEAGSGSYGHFSVRIIPESPTAGTELVATVRGGSETLAFQWMKNGKPIEGANGDRLAPGNFKRRDKVSVIATGGDKMALSSVVIGNMQPIAVGVRLLPEVIYRGVDITADAEGLDPDGDDVSYLYQWVINGEEPDMPEGPILKGDSFKRGDSITVRVVPDDGDLKGTAFVPRPVVVPDAPPSFVTTPPGEFESRTYSYQVAAADPDGDSVKLTLAKAPEGMKMDEGGNITWEIEKKHEGTHEVEIVADDGYGMRAFQRYELTINIPEK